MQVEETVRVVEAIPSQQTVRGFPVTEDHVTSSIMAVKLAQVVSRNPHDQKANKQLKPRYQ